MKALFVAIALTTLLAACGPFGLNPMGYEVLHTPLDEAWARVAAMEYQPDPTGYWKSPAEFFRDGGGDCEDFAAALIYLLGPEASFVGIDMGWCWHAIVEYRGQYLEAIAYQSTYDIDSLTVVERFTYADILEYATKRGTKAISYYTLRPQYRRTR